MITEGKDMKKNLMEFMHQDFGAIRGIEINGEPWLVGKDVARALGYKNANRDIIRHVDEEDRQMIGKTQYQNGIELGQRGGWLINESGFYSLVMGSKLPAARKFKRWVTSEVLPSIRRNGAYMVPSLLDQVMAEPEFLFVVLDRLQTERQGRQKAERCVQKLESRVEEMESKAKFYDMAMTSRTTVSLAQAAAILNLRYGNVTLVRVLKKMGVLKADNTPTRKYLDQGYFTVKEKSISTCDGVKILRSTRVYQKGLSWMARVLK